MIEEKLVRKLLAEGYGPLRLLPSGEVAGLGRQLFTVGLFVGLTETGYGWRYCFEGDQTAVLSLMVWDGKGDPPGPWIKEKPSDRLGPGAGGGYITVQQAAWILIAVSVIAALVPWVGEFGNWAGGELFLWWRAR